MRQTPATPEASGLTNADDRKDYKIDFRLDKTLFERLEQMRTVFGSRSAVIREALGRLSHPISG